MELKDNILVSGNADSTVKIWDILSGQCLQTLSGPNKHQSAVTCLQFNNKFVITSSDDGTVKLWDVKTGQLVERRRLETGVYNSHCRRFHPRSDSSGVWRVRWSGLEDSILANQTGNNRDSQSCLIIIVLVQVCAVGSRNGTEETKLLVLDFDAEVGRETLAECWSSLISIF